MALSTPVSGFSHDGNCAIMSVKAARWVIHGRVSIRPASMWAMMLRKSYGRALRLARMESSRRCRIGAWGKVSSAWVIPTYTRRPAKAQ